MSSTCVIASSSIIGACVLVGLVAIVDFIRRIIPPTIIKFRVLVVLYLIIELAQAIMSDNPDPLVFGVLKCLESACLRPAILYFMENFVGVFLSLEGGKKDRDLTKTKQWWTFARIILFVAYPIVAIAFAFEQTNRVYIGRQFLNTSADVLALFPVSLLVLRVGFSIRKTRANLVVNREDRGPQVVARDKHLKSAQWQLILIGGVTVLLSVVWLYDSFGDFIDIASNLNADWVPPECDYISPIYSKLVPVLLTFYLTRCPSADLRKTANASGTLRTRSGRSLVNLSNLGSRNDSSGGRRSTFSPKDKPSSTPGNVDELVSGESVNYDAGREKPSMWSTPGSVHVSVSGESANDDAREKDLADTDSPVSA